MTGGVWEGGGGRWKEVLKHMRCSKSECVVPQTAAQEKKRVILTLLCFCYRGPCFWRFFFVFVETHDCQCISLTHVHAYFSAFFHYRPHEVPLNGLATSQTPYILVLSCTPQMCPTRRAPLDD